MRGAGTILALALGSGCVSYATGEQLTQRASFDLSCPSKDLGYVRIDGKTQGVIGCGKRGTYLESCEGAQAARTCTWVLNGRVENDVSPPPNWPQPDVGHDY